MGETHPATLARPDIAAPTGDLVAMFFAEMVDEHFLNPRGKGINTNLAYVSSNIIIVTVCCMVRKITYLDFSPRNVKIFSGIQTLLFGALQSSKIRV